MKNMYFRSQNPNNVDRFLSSINYRPTSVSYRKKSPRNETMSTKFLKYSDGFGAPKRQKSVQNDIIQQSDEIKRTDDSENDVTYSKPTTATTTTQATIVSAETASVQTELSKARRLSDLLATNGASTTPTNRMANVTPISIPALADNNSVVKAIIENPPESPNINRTRTNLRPNRPNAKAAWGRWHSWTTCSRSCGGGVMSQRRECLSR